MEMFFFWWLLVPIQFLQLSELLWYLKVTNMGMHLMPFFVVSVSFHSLFWRPFSVKLA